MIDFSTLKGLTIPEGVVTQIADASGRVLWSAVGWPDDLDTGLEFASASAFTMSVATTGWDGTMQYCNGKGWKTWDGSEISSGKTEIGQCIYVRGTGNTRVTNASNAWTLTGTNIECNGNLENLLDYAMVKTGAHPAMASNCYYAMFYNCTSLTKAPRLPATTLASHCYFNMFYGCTSLTTAPSLPATTLADQCYRNMFRGCTALTTAPSLPATTLAASCYNGMFIDCTSLTTVPSLPATTLVSGCYTSMFRYCTKIKLSSTKPGTYTKEYRIPISGTCTTEGVALTTMFSNTGGTFKGAPKINTTYYLDSSNTIV